MAGIPRVRVPDVAVIPRSLLATNPAHVEIGSVVLVVEVLSEGSVRTDRVMKFAEYAEAGIGDYWLVTHTPATLSGFRLDGAAYRLVGDFSAPARLAVRGTDVVVDIPALVEP